MFQKKRWAVIDLVEPSFEFVLAGQDSFVAEADPRDILFTRKFLESILREASKDATVTQKDAVGRPVRKGRGQMVGEPAIFGGSRRQPRCD
jgi:hypothetical protein